MSTNEAPSPERTPAEPETAPVAAGTGDAVAEQPEAAPEAKRSTRTRATAAKTAATRAAAPKTAAAKAPASSTSKSASAKAQAAAGAPADAEATESAPAKSAPRTTRKAAAGAVAAEEPATAVAETQPAPAQAPGADAPTAEATTPEAEPTSPEPAAAAAPAAATAPAQDRPIVIATGRRVIVAEDEALIRLDVVETLTEAGFNVVGEAGDGERAVALATELKPDVVVMDIKMPVMDGITAAERIGRARIAPVVLLTAFSQAELVERARDAGAMAYVVKPFTPAELLPAIEIAIARHQQITALEAEVADLAERFETRKRVERAKGLLMTKMGLSEPEAFRWIQKTSMDRRLTMREVADAVIDQVGQGEKTR